MKASDILVGLFSFDCDRELLTTSWKDDNSDEVERLNELRA